MVDPARARETRIVEGHVVILCGPTCARALDRGVAPVLAIGGQRPNPRARRRTRDASTWRGTLAPVPPGAEVEAQAAAAPAVEPPVEMSAPVPLAATWTHESDSRADGELTPVTVHAPVPRPEPEPVKVRFGSAGTPPPPVEAYAEAAATVRMPTPAFAEDELPPRATSGALPALAPADEATVAPSVAPTVVVEQVEPFAIDLEPSPRPAVGAAPPAAVEVAPSVEVEPAAAPPEAEAIVDAVVDAVAPPPTAAPTALLPVIFADVVAPPPTAAPTSPPVDLAADDASPPLAAPTSPLPVIFADFVPPRVQREAHGDLAGPPEEDILVPLVTRSVVPTPAVGGPSIIVAEVEAAPVPPPPAPPPRAATKAAAVTSGHVPVLTGAPAARVADVAEVALRVDDDEPRPRARPAWARLAIGVLGAAALGGAALAIVQYSTTASAPATAPAPALVAASAPASAPGAAVAPAPAPLDEPVPAPAAVRERALAGLRELMASTSPRVARAAATALARTCEPAALTHLASALTSEGSGIAKVGIARTLAACGDARGRAHLQDALKGGRRDVKAEAARMLVELGEEAGVGPLVEMSVPRMFRVSAGELLALHGHPRGLPLLKAAASDSKLTADERLRAAIALAGAGDDSRLAEARAALDRLDFRQVAALALARRKDPAARPHLVAALALPSLRVGAALGLRRLEPALDPAPLLPPLWRALARDPEVARTTAAEAILVLTGPAADVERP